MEEYFYNNLSRYLNPQTFEGVATIIVLSIWGLIWKSMGFWKSARSNERLWFIAFILLQTLGILEILYLFVFSKDKLTIEKIQDNIKSYKIKNPIKALQLGKSK